MTPHVLLSERLRGHRLTAPARTPVAAARHMAAVQAQDFVAGRWALGVRSSGAPTLRGVDRAFDRGELVRTWTMRGTLHIVPASDLVWMLAVTGARQLRAAASRHRQLGIDGEALTLAERVLRPALADGGLTRQQAFDILDAAGIDPREQRGVHVLFALAVRGVICQGPVVRPGNGGRGDAVAREQRFVLVEDHIVRSDTPADPLAELLVRYVDGHGPATAEDFAWWAGLPLGAARDAVDRAAGRLHRDGEGMLCALAPPRRTWGAAEASLFALPAFDEYYLSYADRSPVCSPADAVRIGPGRNGMVRPTLVADGRVVGVWAHSTAVGRRGDLPVPETFLEADAHSLSVALERYVAFLGG